MFSVIFIVIGVLCAAIGAASFAVAREAARAHHGPDVPKVGIARVTLLGIVGAFFIVLGLADPLVRCPPARSVS